MGLDTATRDHYTKTVTEAGAAHPAGSKGRLRACLEQTLANTRALIEDVKAGRKTLADADDAIADFETPARLDQFVDGVFD